MFKGDFDTVKRARMQKRSPFLLEGEPRSYGARWSLKQWEDPPPPQFKILGSYGHGVGKKSRDSRRNSPHYPPPFRDQVMTGSARKWKLTAAICGEAQSVIRAGLRHNASSSGRRSQEWTFAAT
ncbi:hypothetical protein Bbelb_017320 [Branchiostoma belcheri]|nr:hypothetical protein Bbelb_017320 [Branchiostoma belcheri]